MSPVFAYHHRHGLPVTGGFVHRADPASSFYGVYVFGDYESKRIWGLTQEDQLLTQVRQIGESPEPIVSFGTDHHGRLYLVGYEGMIYQLELDKADFNDPTLPLE